MRATEKATAEIASGISTMSMNEGDLTPRLSKEDFAERFISALELGREQQDEIKGLLKRNAFADIPEQIRRRLDAWKDVKVNVGVIGQSGCGKSTFINTIRGLTAKDKNKGAALVGAVETTLESKPYPHPGNENVILWDLPGVGTPQFPKDRYLSAVDFQSKDFFLIITASRFTVDDAWLAKEALERKKHCYFIRTKVDIDVKNELEDNDLKEKQAITKIRSSCIAHLKAEMAGVGLSNQVPPVFLISGKQAKEYDFEILRASLFDDDMPSIKREAMLCLLQSRSKADVKKKADVIRKGVSWSAGLCALGAVLPLPGLSFGVSLAVFHTQIQSYKAFFGLDDKGLRRHCEECGLPMETIETQLHGYKFHDISVEGIKQLLREVAPEHVGKEIAAAIPLVGATVGATMAYKEAKRLLNYVIDEMEEAVVGLMVLLEVQKRAQASK